MMDSKARPLDLAVRIPVDDVMLAGDLMIPPLARGLVIFAHGSGSSRLSPRNRAVAAELVRGGFATLLFDLLTPDEERREAYTRHLRFDIGLLAGRLTAATDWATRQPGLRELPVGYFGASTGAAAALVAAARRADIVAAVVSRGGRPDLAAESLELVRAPTLLIVGGADPTVLALNRSALARLRCPANLEVVPDAGHLFEERGALERVQALAAAWLDRHMSHARQVSGDLVPQSAG